MKAILERHVQNGKALTLKRINKLLIRQDLFNSEDMEEELNSMNMKHFMKIGQQLLEKHT